MTSVLLKSNLQNINAPIQSLSIYDFDRTITTLTNDLFASSSFHGLQIKHLQFSNSNIQLLKDNSLINLKDSLESLSVVNGKLTNVSRHVSMQSIDGLSEICNWNINLNFEYICLIGLFERKFLSFDSRFTISVLKLSSTQSSNIDVSSVSYRLLFITRQIKFRNSLRDMGKWRKVCWAQINVPIMIFYHSKESDTCEWIFLLLRTLFIQMAITIKNESYLPHEYRINYDFYCSRRRRMVERQKNLHSQHKSWRWYT